MHLKSAFYFIWFQIEKLMTTWLIIKLDISCNPIVDSEFQHFAKQFNRRLPFLQIIRFDLFKL